MQVNDRVRLLEPIYEHADDHSPGGYLAYQGEALVIRKVYEPGSGFAYAVSHENVTDNSFAVCAHEIELIKDQQA